MLNSFLALSPRARYCVVLALLVAWFLLTACFGPER